MLSGKQGGVEMATYSKKKIQCECGHEGHIRCRESDQPYGGLWETHTLKGFEGGSCHIEGLNKVKDMIAELAPICPNCGQTEKVHYVR